MAKRIFDYDAAYAAICLWEEIIQPAGPDASTPWQDFREQHGTAGLRDFVLVHLAGPCDAAWTRAIQLYEEASQGWYAKRADEAPPTGQRAEYEAWRAANPEPQDPGSFDWEFVPFWVRACVDWSGEVPRVLTTMSERVT